MRIRNISIIPWMLVCIPDNIVGAFLSVLQPSRGTISRGRVKHSRWCRGGFCLRSTHCVLRNLHLGPRQLRQEVRIPLWSSQLRQAAWNRTVCEYLWAHDTTSQSLANNLIFRSLKIISFNLDLSAEVFYTISVQHQ